MGDKIAITNLSIQDHTLHSTVIWVQILSFLAIFLVFAYFIAKVPRKRRLDAILNTDPDEIESLSPEDNQTLAQRLMPALRRLNKRKIVKQSDSALGNIQQLMMHADGFMNLSADDFGLFRFFIGVVGAILAFLYWMLTKSSLAMVMVIVLFFAGYFIPYMMLKSKAQQRQKRINSQILDMCGLMKVAILAGNTPNSALGHCAEKLEGDLAKELGKAYREVRVGTPRSEALTNMATRCGVEDLNTFVEMMNMAEQFGSDAEQLAETMDIIVNDIRQRREQKQEASAQKAMLKMLFPTVLFLLPPMFLFLMGPGILGGMMGGHS